MFVLRVFVTGKPSWPSLFFVGKVKSLRTGAPAVLTRVGFWAKLATVLTLAIFRLI